MRKPRVSVRSEAPVPLFVVERFLPALTPEGVQAQAQRDQAAAGIRHLRTTYLRDDELCFSLFEADSSETVRRANDEIGMPYERITEAIDVAPEAIP
jgi:hypothetical protein